MPNFNFFKNRFTIIVSLSGRAGKIFKEFLQQTVIYIIFVNKPDGSLMWYLGITNNIPERILEHISCVKRGVNTKLYNHIREYGLENFYITVIKLNFPFLDSTLRIMEVRLITKFQPNLNTDKTVSNGARAPETILKLREVQRSKMKPVFCLNIEKGEVIEFDSIRACAKAFGVNHGSILHAIKNNRIFKKTFLLYFKNK